MIPAPMAAVLNELDSEEWFLTTKRHNGARWLPRTLCTWSGDDLLDHNEQPLEPGRYSFSLRPRDRTRANRERLWTELGDRTSRWTLELGSDQPAAIRTSSSVPRARAISRAQVPGNTGQPYRPVPDERAELADEKAAREAAARAERARREAEALQAEQHLERIKAASSNPTRDILEAMRSSSSKPDNPLAGALAALAPVLSTVVQAWSSAQAASAARMDKLLEVLARPRENPQPLEQAAQVSANLELARPLDQLKTLRELFSFARELVPSGGGGDDGNETSKLIDLVRTFVEARPAPTPQRAPAPVRRMPAPQNAEAVAMQRTAHFLEAVLLELGNDSDPEAVADAMFDRFGLLPSGLRSAVCSLELGDVNAQLDKIIGPEARQAFNVAVGSKAGGVEWLQRFVSALADPEDDAELDDDEPAERNGSEAG